MSTTAEGSRELIRVDALEKVTGQAKYIEDLPHIPGLAFAVLGLLLSIFFQKPTM